MILKELTDANIPCAVSTGDFDHSKIMIVDDIAVVGSTNLDYRSLHRNHEANIEVHDERLTSDFIALFEKTFIESELIDCLHPKTGKNILRQFTSLIAGLY